MTSLQNPENDPGASGAGPLGRLYRGVSIPSRAYVLSLRIPSKRTSPCFLVSAFVYMEPPSTVPRVTWSNGCGELVRTFGEGAQYSVVPIIDMSTKVMIP